MSEYLLTVITPNGKIFDDKVQSVTAPGKSGSFGVLSNHAPIISALKKGIIQVKASGQDKEISIASGVLEVSEKGDVLILADEQN